MADEKLKNKQKKKFQQLVGQLAKVQQPVAQIGGLPKDCPRILFFSEKLRKKKRSRFDNI